MTGITQTRNATETARKAAVQVNVESVYVECLIIVNADIAAEFRAAETEFVRALVNDHPRDARAAEQRMESIPAFSEQVALQCPHK